MIRNPFPQMGTHESVPIDPVGYGKRLDRIVSLIDKTCGQQPIFIGIRGKFGLGKSTVLGYFKDKLKDNFLISELDLDHIIEKKEYTLIQKLQEVVGNLNTSKKGAVVLIDEGQKIAKGKEIYGGITKLTTAQERFLEDLRQFSEVKFQEMRRMALVVALHPESYMLLFERSGRLDVFQRVRTEFLELSDIDHFSAHKIVDGFIQKEKLRFEDYFDRSVVNCIYALLPHIEKEEYYAERNGRTLSQIFFQLFEEAQENGKITNERIRNILLGNTNITFAGKPLTLRNVPMFKKQKEKLSEASGKLYEKMVFNPWWEGLEDIPTSLQSEIDNIQHLVSRRKGVLLTEEQLEQLKDTVDVDSLITEGEDMVRTYVDGRAIYLAFTDQLPGENKEEFLRLVGNLKPQTLIRISEDQLLTLYGSREGGPYAEVIGDYLDSEGSTQLSRVYNILKRDLHKEMESKSEEGQFRFLWRKEYNFNFGVRLNVMLFFFPQNFQPSHTPEQIIKAAENELENFEPYCDIGIVLFDPWVTLSDRIQKLHIELRGMKNRLFLRRLQKGQLGKLLKDHDIQEILEYIRECLTVFMQEAVEKGYTIPLNGFKERPGVNKSRFIEVFAKQISKAWLMSVTRHELWWEAKKEYEKFDQWLRPQLQSERAEGGERTSFNLAEVKTLAKETLQKYKFVEIREDDGSSLVTGGNLSIYERNLLNLFRKNRRVKRDSLCKLIKKYFASYTRFEFVPGKGDDIGLIFLLLRDKGLIEYCETKDEYRLISVEEMVDRTKKEKIEVINKDILTRGEKEQLESAQRRVDMVKKEGLKLADDDFEEIAHLNSMLLALKVDIEVPEELEMIYELARKINSMIDEPMQLGDEYALSLDDIPLANYSDLNKREEALAQKYASEDPGLVFHDSEANNKEIWWTWCVSVADSFKGDRRKVANKIFKQLTVSESRVLSREQLVKVLRFIQAFHDGIGRLRVIIMERWEELEDKLKQQKKWLKFEEIITKASKMKRWDLYLGNLPKNLPSMVENEKEKTLFINVASNIGDFAFFYGGYLKFLEKRLAIDALKRLNELEETGPPKWSGEWKGINSYIGWIRSRKEEDWILHELQLLLRKDNKGTRFNKADFIHYLERMGLEYDDNLEDQVMRTGNLVRIIGEKHQYKKGKLRKQKTTDYELVENQHG